mmetsp:Transcript_12628/g.15913  ORF Transcript_12628/g.15913 Transcript_12628/m.15913 type:complete len:380 (+) Transcript_12628:78-1217(+)
MRQRQCENIFTDNAKTGKKIPFRGTVALILMLSNFSESALRPNISRKTSAQRMFYSKSFISTRSSQPIIFKDTGKLLRVLRGGDSSDDDDEDESDVDESDVDVTTEDDDETDVDVTTEDDDKSDDIDSSEEVDDDGEEEMDDNYDEYDSELEIDEKDEVKVASEEVSETDQDSRYDPLIPVSPIQQMAVSMGVMMLSKKLDLKDKKIIKWCRVSFLLYILITQAFLIYVRLCARRDNDTTPISMTTHPLLANLLPSNTPSIAKDIANKLLSSQSTVMEYDLAQANQMNNKLMFPLVFMWFIHYKMGQVQPLLYQASSGLFNLVNSPLWQVYIWGRNLERPWKMIGMYEQDEGDKESENPEEENEDQNDGKELQGEEKES